MVYDDYSIVRKSNKGNIKIMNIFIAVHLLTIDDIKKITHGKRVRKGNYLFYTEKFAVADINLEDIITLDEVKKEKDDCTPFEDLESDDFDNCTPFEDLESDDDRCDHCEKNECDCHKDDKGDCL